MLKGNNKIQLLYQIFPLSQFHILHLGAISTPLWHDALIPEVLGYWQKLSFYWLLRYFSLFLFLRQLWNKIRKICNGSKERISYLYKEIYFWCCHKPIVSIRIRNAGKMVQFIWCHQCVILVRNTKVFNYDPNWWWGIYCSVLIIINRYNKVDNCVYIYVDLDIFKEIFSSLVWFVEDWYLVSIISSAFIDIVELWSFKFIWSGKLWWHTRCIL